MNRLICSMAALVASLTVVASLPSPVKVPNNPVPCCPIPHDTSDVLPLGRGVTAEDCPRFCPWVKNGGLKRRMFCFRSHQKAGSSVALKIMHDAIPSIMKELKYDVVQEGAGWLASWGFAMEVDYENKTVVVVRGKSANLYKHMLSVNPDCHLITTVRDPRDAAVSLYRHHRPTEPFPTNWWNQGTSGLARLPVVARQAINMQANYLKFFPAMEGMLLLEYSRFSNDLPDTLAQLLAFMHVDTSTEEFLAGGQDIVNRVSIQYSKQTALRILKAKYNDTKATAEVVKQRVKGTGWLHATHFNGGTSSKKALSASDLEGFNALMCEFQVVAGFYGVPNCNVATNARPWENAITHRRGKDDLPEVIKERPEVTEQGLHLFGMQGRYKGE